MDGGPLPRVCVTYRRPLRRYANVRPVVQIHAPGRKAAAAIVVLAMVAYSHHAAEDRTRFAELVTLDEVEPIREPMSLRPGANRMCLSELLTAADQEHQTRLRTPAISGHPRETFRQDNADRAKSSCKVNQS